MRKYEWHSKFVLGMFQFESRSTPCSVTTKCNILIDFESIHRVIETVNKEQYFKLHR